MVGTGVRGVRVANARGGYSITEARRGKALLPLAACAALVGVLLAGMSAEPSAWPAYAMGALLAGVCAVPIVLWLRGNRRALPMFGLICLSYAAQYALPLYLQPDQLIVNSMVVTFSWDQTVQAVLLVSVGIAAMIIAYYAAKRVLERGTHLRLDLPLAREARTRYIAFGLAIGLGALALADFGLSPGGASGLGAFFRVAADQTYVAIALLGLGVYSRELRGRWILALYASVAVASLLGLASGLLENAMIPLVVLAVVYWRGRGRPPLRLFLVGAVLFVLLDSVKMEYRSQAWYGGQQPSIVSRLGLWAALAGGAADRLATGDPAAQLAPLSGNAGSRLDLLHTFIYVQGATPRTVPYLDGGTYSYLWYGWVPRFLWPGKPQAQINTTQVSVDYGLAAPGGTSTIGLGQPAEAYANFGAIGVVIVLVLEGIFFALVDHALNGPRSQGGAAIYLAIMVFFLNGVGSYTATVFGSVIQDVVAMTIVMKVIAATGRDAPRSPLRRSIPQAVASTHIEGELSP